MNNQKKPFLTNSPICSIGLSIAYLNSIILSPTDRKTYTFIIILLPFFMFGQTKKGYKYLKKKAFPEAKTAFEKDTLHPYYAAAAAYELAKFYQKYSKDYDSLKIAHYWANKADAEYNDLSPKQQKKYRKLKIHSKSTSSQKKSIQNKALKLIENNSSINKYDDFKRCFTPFNKRIEKKVQIKRNEIVKNSLRNIKNLKYKELTSLTKNHSELLFKNSLKFKNIVNEQLYNSFLKEYGYSELTNLVEDHPEHWIASECWLEEFTVAMDATTKKELIQFLQSYPMSLFDHIVEYNIAMGMKPLGGLDNDQKMLLDLSKEGHFLRQKLEDNSNISDEELPQNIVNYVRQVAPSQRAYYLTQKAIQYYLKAKKWDTTLYLTRETQSLFPDEQPSDCESNFRYYSTKEEWYETALPIFEIPADNIKLSAIEELNTKKKDETSPVITANGQELYFASNRNQNNSSGNDIFMSKYDFTSKRWREPILVQKLSTKEDEAPLSITSDGKTLLLFRDGKLYISKLIPHGWSEPKLISEEINSFAWIGRSVLSADGNVLIFAASNDVKESFYTPKIDIYVSFKDENDNFSSPFSIGENINTINGQERSPFLHLDMQTLYFSSDGHGGLGGTDIFMSKRLDDTWTNWSEPQNLGKEINTLENDWGYNLSVSASSEIAYLSSDELAWGNQSDLYATGIPTYVRAEPKKVITGKLKRNSDKLVGPATKIIIRDSETGEEIARVSPQPDGTFIVPLDVNINNIDYEVVDRNALPTSGTINIGETNQTYFDESINYITKDDLKAGKSKLENVLFESGKAELLPSSYKIIKGLYRLVKNETDSVIKISGHTDNEGSHDFNIKLSQKRANAVKQYLAELGISDNRIITSGHGFTKPIHDNNTEKGRALNRRVEVQLLNK